MNKQDVFPHMLNLFDTHCHVDFQHYDSDRDAMLQRAQDAGVKRMLIAGVDPESIQRAARLVKAHDDLYMAVGIHPNSTANWQPSADLDRLREWATGAKVVAIGEIGLDYHWDKSPKAQQHRAFKDQLALAAELALPVIIHNREADEDTLPILEEWAKTVPPSLRGRVGVWHSFSAPLAYAERALAAGFYLGFSGPVTYKNAESLRHVAGQVPLDRLLVETDAPFLTPLPHRGKRNEPAYVALVAERLAALHQVEITKLAEQTTQNALRLFNLSA